MSFTSGRLSLGTPWRGTTPGIVLRGYAVLVVGVYLYYESSSTHDVMDGRSEDPTVSDITDSEDEEWSVGNVGDKNHLNACYG